MRQISLEIETPRCDIENVSRAYFGSEYFHKPHFFRGLLLPCCCCLIEAKWFMIVFYLCSKHHRTSTWNEYLKQRKVSKYLLLQVFVPNTTKNHTYVLWSFQCVRFFHDWTLEFFFRSHCLMTHWNTSSRTIHLIASVQRSQMKNSMVCIHAPRALFYMFLASHPCARVRQKYSRSVPLPISRKLPKN